MIKVADIIEINDEYLYIYSHPNPNYAIVEKIIYHSDTCNPYLFLVRWLSNKNECEIVLPNHITKISSEDDDD